MEITYKAKDGKVFTDECDCRLYELFLDEHAKSQIRGLDAELNLIPFSSPNFMGDIEAVIIDTEEALRLFKERAKIEEEKGEENVTFDDIDSPGAYMTDYLVPDVEGEELWFSMDEAIEIIEEFIDEEYKKIKEMEQSIAEIQRIKGLLN